MAPRLTDEQKKRRGTLRSDTSAESIGQKAVTKILEFPVLREIPKSQFPFNETGKETFDYWAVRMRDAGLLTKVSFGQIESLALQDHIIADAMAAGKMPPQVAVQERRKILTWIEGLNVSDSVVSGKRAKSNFASNGFPNRLRDPASHRARMAG